MLSGSENYKQTLSVTMPFSIMSIRSLSQHWHASWKDIRFKWHNFIECLLSGIQHEHGYGMSMWRFVLFTLALWCCILHTLLFYIDCNILDLSWTTQCCLSLYFREFCRWMLRKWIHIYWWGRVQPHKSKKERQKYHWPQGYNQCPRATWG